MSSMHKGAAGGLVYSTEGGRMCPLCRQSVSTCTCRAAAQAVPAGDGVVRVSRETDGGGKAVMLVLGMRLDAAMLAVMARGCAAPAARAAPPRTTWSRCGAIPCRACDRAADNRGLQG